MPRLAAVLTLLAACSGSHVATPPLPPLVVPPPPAAAGSDQRVIIGEHLIWEVAADGMTIGRAEMIVRDREIESRFGTDGVASMFADVHEHLTTPIAHARGAYTIHSALAWVRAWDPRDSAPAALDIIHDGDHYKVTCEPPIPDELDGARVERVACSVATGDPVELAVQLGDDADRVPVRVVAKIGTTRIEAKLVSRDLRGSRATPVPPAHASLR
jgi:hypothetical protein